MHTSIEQRRLMAASYEQRDPRLFILAGIPGSGKSTWARIFFHPWQIINLASSIDA